MNTSSTKNSETPTLTEAISTAVFVLGGGADMDPYDYDMSGYSWSDEETADWMEVYISEVGRF